MTTEVKKFEYPDLTQRKSASGGGTEAISKYKEPKFEAHVNAKAIDAIHKKADASFKLDQIVIDQLGIDDRERVSQEAKIAKEIERRWEQAAEKAEVAGYTR